MTTNALGTFDGNITFTNNAGGGNSAFLIPVTGTVGNGGGGGGDPADLAPTFKGKLPATVKSGKKKAFKLKVVNAGGSKAKGLMDVKFYLSQDAVFNAGDTLALTKTGLKLNVKKNQAKLIKAKLGLPEGTLPGAYFIVAVVEPADTVGDADAANNTVASATAVTFQ